MTIDELHDKLFDVLLVIDKICRDNNICYFLDGGTELGAVREKDFIPWDDDLDIGVLYEDYQSFRDVMIAKLPEHMHFVEACQFSPLFYDFTIRIIDDRWLIRDETEADRAYQNLQNRVGTDVFLYCGIPKSKFGQWLFFTARKILWGMGIHYRYSIDWDKYSLFQKMAVKFLTLFGGFFSGHTPERIFKLHDKLISLFDAKKTGFRYSGNGSILKHYENVFLDEWFSKNIHMYIRNKRFPVISGYDCKLTCKYGNYMKPEKNSQKYVTHL